MAVLGAVRGVWALIGMVVGATVVAQVVYGLGATLFSHNTSTGALPRVALLTAAYNALLAPLLMPLLRRLSLGERPDTDATV